MIKINVEREIAGDGSRKSRLVSFSGLCRNELPNAYSKNGKECTLFESSGILFVNSNNIPSWYINHSVDEETFEKIMAHIKRSGDNLMAVNAHLAELRKTWHGIKTYKI